MIRKPPLSGLQLAALATPVLGVLLLLIFTIGSNVAASREASRANEATEFVESLTVLVHELQEERDRSSGQVASGRDRPTDDLVEQREEVDQAANLYVDALDGLPADDLGQPFADAVKATSDDLDAITAQREALDGGEADDFAKATGYYVNAIGRLLTVMDRVADASTTAEARASLRTVSTFAWAKESASQERALLLWMLTTPDGVRDEANRVRLSELIGAEQAWLTQFRVAATDQQEELFGQTVAGDDVDQVAELRTRAVSEPDRLDADASGWLEASTANLDLMREVERQLVDKAKADSAAARSEVSSGALSGTVPTLLVLLAAVGGGFLLTRSLPQPSRPERSRAPAEPPYEPAGWPEEPTPRFGGPDGGPGPAPARVLNPYDQPQTGPQPVVRVYDQSGAGVDPMRGYDQPQTGPQPTVGWPGAGSQSGGWPAAPPAAGGPSGQWPSMPTQAGGMVNTGEHPIRPAPPPAGPPGQAPWQPGGGMAERPVPPGPPPPPPRPAPPPAWRAAPVEDQWPPGGGRPAAPPGPPWSPAGQPAAAGGGLPRRGGGNERLPIFEETRYDWFKTSGGQRAGGDVSDILAEATNDPARLFGDPIGIAESQPTQAGLPKRRQGASIASGLAVVSNGTRAGAGTVQAPPPLANSIRSPDDLRAALDSYQSGFERGRQEALRWFKDLPGEPGR